MNKLQGGFSLIEALLVLAATSLFLVTSIALFSGKQRETQFQQGVRDLEAKITDIMNDVSVGNYEQNISGLIDCSVAPTGELSISAAGAANAPGTNTSCVLTGKAIKINKESMTIFTILGKRNVTQTQLAQTIAEVKPVIVTSLFSDDYSFSNAFVALDSIEVGENSNHDAALVAFVQSSQTQSTLTLLSGTKTPNNTQMSIDRNLSAPPALEASYMYSGSGLTSPRNSIVRICLSEDATFFTANYEAIIDIQTGSSGYGAKSTIGRGLCNV